jgi:hypothetical protein
MVGGGLLAADHGVPDVRFCIARSMGRVVAPRSEVQNQPTIGVNRNLPSAARRNVPVSAVEPARGEVSGGCCGIGPAVTLLADRRDRSAHSDMRSSMQGVGAR